MKIFDEHKDLLKEAIVEKEYVKGVVEYSWRKKMEYNDLTFYYRTQNIFKGQLIAPNEYSTIEVKATYGYVPSKKEATETIYFP